MPATALRRNGIDVRRKVTAGTTRRSSARARMDRSQAGHLRRAPCGPVGQPEKVAQALLFVVKRQNRTAELFAEHKRDCNVDPSVAAWDSQLFFGFLNSILDRIGMNVQAVRGRRIRRTRRQIHGELSRSRAVSGLS